MDQSAAQLILRLMLLASEEHQLPLHLLRLVICTVLKAIFH